MMKRFTKSEALAPSIWSAIRFVIPIESNMNTQWCEEWPNMLQSAQTRDEVLVLLVQYGQELGFQYCECGIRLPLPVSRTLFVALNNYPEAWQTHYKEKSYFAHDPIVQPAFKSSALLRAPSKRLRRRNSVRTRLNLSLVYSLMVGAVQLCHRKGGNCLGQG
jgi:hypothetical protein